MEGDGSEQGTRRVDRCAVTSSRVAAFSILLAGLLFSTGGAAIKGCSFDAWEVAALRSGIAAIVILVLVPRSRGGWTKGIVAVACAHAATLVLFVASNKNTTAANAIFLQSTAPLWVLLAGPFVLAEPIRRRDVLVVAMLAIGMTAFFVGVDDPSATAPDPAFGDVLGALSGLTWAATLLGLRALGRGGAQRASAAAALGCILSCLFAVPMIWLDGAAGLRQATASDWIVVAYLGIFQVGIAYVLMTRAVPHVPAFLVALLLMIEPICNPLWAFLVHGETPRLLAVVGGAVIGAALITKPILDRRAMRTG
jgi:drug/metabolite transporter (DMT)-like permease